MLLPSEQRAINCNAFDPQARTVLQSLFGARSTTVAIGQGFTVASPTIATLMSVVIPASELVPGSLFRFTACGAMTNNTGTSIKPAFGMSVNGTPLFSSVFGLTTTIAPSTQTRAWRAAGLFFVPANGQVGYQTTPVQSAIKVVVPQSSPALTLGGELHVSVSQPFGSATIAVDAIDPVASPLMTYIGSPFKVNQGQQLTLNVFGGFQNVSTSFSQTYAILEGI